MAAGPMAGFSAEELERLRREYASYDPKQTYAMPSPTGSLTAAPPANPLDRLAQQVTDSDYFRRLSPEAQKVISGTGQIAEMAPPVAAARGGYDIGAGAASGDYGQTIQGAVNALPEVGPAAKGALAAFDPALSSTLAGLILPARFVKRAEQIGPGLAHPSLEKAVTDVERKQAGNLAYQPVDVPPGQEYDYLRTKPGNYDLGWDAKKERYFAERTPSESEAELKKQVDKAEAALKKGQISSPFTLEKDVYEQPYRPRDIGPLPSFAKGTPDWITAQLPEARDRSAAAIARAEKEGGPGAGKFYHLGKYYDDLKAAHGTDVANMIMDDYGQMMGATTAFSKPSQNQRAAMLHLQRMYQGLPVPENPAYPFGHMFHTTTHAPGIQQVYDTGLMNAAERPKGTLFGGAVSGTRQNTVIDQVETKGMNIRDQSGKVQSNPPGNSYTDFMTMRDNLARELGYGNPTEAQALSWAGFQATPEEVRLYSRPHMLNIGDRAAVTAHVTGRDPFDVYNDMVRYGISTL